MTTKHEIEIEGLPEGYRAVAFRLPKIGEWCWDGYKRIYKAEVSQIACFIVEKPRRIVLEETEEASSYFVPQYLHPSKNVNMNIVADKIWREVNEGE